MARTIGRKYKNLIRKLVGEANQNNINDVFEYVKEKLPIEVFDTWECAHSEIERLVNDIIMEGV